MKYTVIGLYVNDWPEVAGVIEGEHECVDQDPRIVTATACVTAHEWV